MHILSKIIYRVNAIPNKNPMILFVEIEKKKKSKIHQESEETQIAKTIKKEYISGCITLLDFKIYFTPK